MARLFPLIGLLSCLPLSAPAGSPAETKLAGQVIGESADEWMHAYHLSLPDICGPHKKGDKEMNYKAVCRSLASFRAGNMGTFSTNDERSRTITWTFSNGRVAEAELHQILDFYAAGSHFAPSTAEEQIRFLSEVYGPPTEQRVIQYTNEKGGKWEGLEATRAMPDGALIIGREMISAARDFTVHIFSRERLAEIDRENKAKPNPYSR